MIAYGIERSDAVTAVSEELVRQTVKQLQIKKNIEVIYNFVNENEYMRKDREHLKKHYHIDANEKVIIHISNFRKVKRVHDVILTFEKIYAKIKSKLIMVGDGPELQSARDLVQKLGIQDAVLFLGRQKKISDLLSISDLKLLMSEQESFGLVLLEAMACEVPTIGTNVGGSPEVIEENKTGYIVELGSINEASEKAVHLLSDATLLEQFSKQAKVRVEEHFSSKAIVWQYIDLYNRLLA